MKKESIVNKIIVLALAVIAIFSQSVSYVYAAEVQTNSEIEYFDIVSDEIQVGDIVGSDSEKTLVIEVNEGGSFKTMKISENTYASVKCNHT